MLRFWRNLRRSSISLYLTFACVWLVWLSYLNIGSPLASSALVIICDQSSNPQNRHGVQTIGYMRLRSILRLVVVALGVTALSSRCNPLRQGWCSQSFKQPSPNYAFSSPRELERYYCSKVLLCVIAIFTHELVLPYRTKVIEKYLGTLNLTVVLSTQLDCSFILQWNSLMCIIHKYYHFQHLPPLQFSRYTSQQIHDGELSTSLTIVSLWINTILQNIPG